MADITVSTARREIAAVPRRNRAGSARCGRGVSEARPRRFGGAEGKTAADRAGPAAAAAGEVYAGLMKEFGQSLSLQAIDEHMKMILNIV